MILALRQRLEAAVPALAGRVEGVAELADLQARDALPQVTPWAFVVPGDLDGGGFDALEGFFRQAVARSYSVVLVLRTGDPTGRRALLDFEPLREAALAAVAGWAPEATTGPFALRRGRLLSLQAGTLVYELAFATADHIRIMP